MLEDEDDRRERYAELIRRSADRLRERDPLGVATSPLEAMVELMELARQEGLEAGSNPRVSSNSAVRALKEAGSLDQLLEILERAWPWSDKALEHIWPDVPRHAQDALIRLFPHDWAHHAQMVCRLGDRRLDAYVYVRHETAAGRRVHGYHRVYPNGAISNPGTPDISVDTANLLVQRGLLEEFEFHPEGVGLVPTAEAIGAVMEACRAAARRMRIPIADTWHRPWVTPHWITPGNFEPMPPPPYDEPFAPPPIPEDGWQSALPEEAAQAIRTIATAVEMQPGQAPDPIPSIETLIQSGQAEIALDTLGRHLPTSVLPRIATAFRTVAVFPRGRSKPLVWMAVNGQPEARVMREAVLGKGGGAFLRELLCLEGDGHAIGALAAITAERASEMTAADWWEFARAERLEDRCPPQERDRFDLGDWLILPLQVTPRTHEELSRAKGQYPLPGAPSTGKDVVRAEAAKLHPAHGRLFDRLTLTQRREPLPFPPRFPRACVDDALLDVAIGVLDAHAAAERRRIVDADPHMGGERTNIGFSEVTWHEDRRILSVQEALRAYPRGQGNGPTPIHALMEKVELPFCLVEGRRQGFLHRMKARTVGGAVVDPIPATWDNGMKASWGYSKHEVDMDALRRQAGEGTRPGPLRRR